MKLKLYLGVVALLCASLCAAQRATVFGSTIVQGISVSGSSVWLQGTSATISSQASPEVQGSCGASPAASCTFQLPQATTAHSEYVVGVITDSSNNLTMSTVYTCTNSGGCNSGNAIDTLSLCAASACHLHTANDNIDLAYTANSAGGATYVTATASGIPSSNYYYYEFAEVLPPLCNGVRCTGSFDKAATYNTGTCGTCTGTSMAITATDNIIQIVDSSSFLAGIGSPYFGDFIGNFFSLDATSDSGPTITSSGYWTEAGVAFKTNGGSYTPTAVKFTSVNGAPPTNHAWFPASATQACNPSCTITFNATTTSGNLGFLHAVDESGTGRFISSIAGWTVPTGANTCQQNLTGANAQSCAYNLSLGAVASISVTMTGNCSACQFVYYEIHRTSGSFLLDTQNSATPSNTTNILTGQSASITGPDVAFQECTWTSTALVQYGSYLYPLQASQNFFTQAGVSLALLNDYTGGAPAELMSGNLTTSGCTGIWFK